MTEPTEVDRQIAAELFGSRPLGKMEQIIEIQAQIVATLLAPERGKSRWIPVEEQLPEIVSHWGPRNMYGGSKVVLVFTRRATLETAVHYESGGWDATGGDILDDVTHWMKLPEPPFTKAALEKEG